MDNRHALIVDCRVTQAVGTGERDAAKAMAADIPGAHQKTLGADKNYDTRRMVAELRRIGVTPHVAQNTSRPGGSAIDGRTTRHEGYAKSINARRGKGECGVWAARDRLQSDAPRQPAQTDHDGGMNSRLPRGVGRRQRSGSSTGAKRLKSGVLNR
jgi:hypothetical protein